jgi:Tfp pilus assembly protein PilF
MALSKLCRGRPSSAVALIFLALVSFALLLVNNNWAGTNQMSSEDEMVARGYRALWASPVDINASLSAFESALRQDPASPLRWEDLGGALLTAGRPGQASYCFRQAIRLAPHVPAVQMRFANFQMQAGRTIDALTLMRDILGETAAYDEVIFSYYQRLELQIDQVLDNGIPKTPRAVAAFFQNSLQQHDADKTRAIQKWAEARGLMHVGAPASQPRAPSAF